MKSFNALAARVSYLTEARVSPYAKTHPSFGGITKQMKTGGLSSAPLDTIKFIRETLYMLHIIDDEELSMIKTAKGFSGKKHAMLSVLKYKQEDINQQSDEIAKQVEDTLDDFIGGVGVNRSREEKYGAQAAAEEIAKAMRAARSGKEMDDAIVDVIDGEALIVRASIAKILGDINKNLGDPGFDIEALALDEVTAYAGKIDSVSKLKSFVQQISTEPGYEKIAAYLSSAIKPIQNGTEDEEMEDQEDEYEQDLDDLDDRDPYERNMRKPRAHDGLSVDDALKQSRRPAPIEDEEGDDEDTHTSLVYNHDSGEVHGDFETTQEAIAFNSKLRRGSIYNLKYFRENEDDIRSGKIKHGGAAAGLPGFDFEDEEGGQEDELSGASDHDLYDYAHQMGIEEILVMDGGGGIANREEVIAALRAVDEDAEEDDKEVVKESYTSNYMGEQVKKDKYSHKRTYKSESFNEHYNPKNSYQLQEMQRMGYGN